MKKLIAALGIAGSLASHSWAHADTQNNLWLFSPEIAKRVHGTLMKKEPCTTMPNWGLEFEWVIHGFDKAGKHLGSGNIKGWGKPGESCSEVSDRARNEFMRVLLQSRPVPASSRKIDL